MRSPDEQEEFLSRSRFGEGENSKAPIALLTRIGLLLVLAAVGLLGYPLLFESGRDSHGGIMYVVGAMYLAIAGAACFVVELGRRLFARFRRGGRGLRRES
jgi:hypothetical protein